MNSWEAMVMPDVENAYFLEVMNYLRRKVGFVEERKLVVCWRSPPTTIKENRVLRSELSHYRKIHLIRGLEFEMVSTSV